MSLVYKEVFEDGYPVECEWAMEADSADLHKMRDQLRALAAIAPEKKKRRVNLWKCVNRDEIVAKPEGWEPNAYNWMWERVTTATPIEIDD